MTAAALKNVLDSLPRRVLAKLSKLAKETGEPAESIVERGVALYERRHRLLASSKHGQQDKLARIKADPKKLPIYEEIMSAMQERSAKSISAEKKTARAAAGAAARAKKLTPEARKKIASDAAKKRWKNNAEEAAQKVKRSEK